jgi:DNA-binding beta-propeller fold protein YncE
MNLVRQTQRLRALAVLSLALCTIHCGTRPDSLDAPVQSISNVALENGFALLDPKANRVLLLTPQDNGDLVRKSIPVGVNAVSASASADQKTLYVLSTGVSRPENANDEGPSLSVIAQEGAATRLALSSPLSGLAVDPKGRWLVVYPGKDNGAFVQNPNQVILVDLKDASGPKAYPRTIRSFGGRPVRLTFTEDLSLPLEKTRLLVIETEQDLTLLDLNHVSENRPEITVRLTSGQSARVVNPAGLVVDDGDPDKNDDARIAVRLGNDSSVVILTLGAVNNASGSSPNSFAPAVNLADVGGIPSSIAFLRTEGGPRLAALVPSRRKAVLIETATSLLQEVDLPEAYRSMSLVTNEVTAAGQASKGDVALLYGGTQSVAFWQLGQTAGKPYRSIETIAVGGGADTVQAVAAPNGSLRVLSSAGQSFYVLNLNERTASPLSASERAKIYVAPSGTRLWAYASQNLAYLPLQGLSPLALPLERAASEVFEVRGPTKNLLVALHNSGAYGVTILSADSPDVRNAKTTYGLLLEGLSQ